MTEVGLRELRQQASELVRRAEAGEEIIITVAGRPSVQLMPVGPRAWRRRDELGELFHGPADPDRAADRDLIDGGLIDPFAAR